VAAPVFAEGTCVGFAAVWGHYVDIGGSGPGSANPFMRDLHGEGLRIPPMRLYRRGEVNRDILNMFLANVRGPEEILGDLRASTPAATAAASRWSARLPATAPPSLKP